MPDISHKSLCNCNILFCQGHYKVSNLTLNMKALEVVPLDLENREWNVTLQAWDAKEEPWMCFNFVFKIFRTGRSRVPQ